MNNINTDLISRITDLQSNNMNKTPKYKQLSGMINDIQNETKILAYTVRRLLCPVEQ